MDERHKTDPITIAANKLVEDIRSGIPLAGALKKLGKVDRAAVWDRIKKDGHDLSDMLLPEGVSRYTAQGALMLRTYDDMLRKLFHPEENN